MKEKLEISEDMLEQLQDMTRDYARGEVLFSGDSSDDDSTTTDEDEDVGEFEWGELDQDALWDDGEREVEVSKYKQQMLSMNLYMSILAAVYRTEN